MNPEDLIPKLPKPKDLQPFPTTQSLVSEQLTDPQLDSSSACVVSASKNSSWIRAGQSLNAVFEGGLSKARLDFSGCSGEGGGIHYCIWVALL